MMATKEHRKPSYPAALRMARLAFELPSHPFGWTLDAIQRDLDISKRTLKRYLAASKDGLLDRMGRPGLPDRLGWRKDQAPDALVPKAG